MKTIADHFKTFSAAVIPPTASPHQRADMRMAFYGGASVMLTLMNQAAAASVSDDIGVTRIAHLEEELRTFVNKLGGLAR